MQRLYPLETSNLNPDEEEETNNKKGVPTKEAEEDCDPMSARSEVMKETCRANCPERAAAQRSRN